MPTVTAMVWGFAGLGSEKDSIVVVFGCLEREESGNIIIKTFKKKLATVTVQLHVN